MLNMASQEDCVALDISEHKNPSVGELVTQCTELFSVTFYSSLKSLDVKV